MGSETPARRRNSSHRGRALRSKSARLRRFSRSAYPLTIQAFGSRSWRKTRQPASSETRRTNGSSLRISPQLHKTPPEAIAACAQIGASPASQQESRLQKPSCYPAGQYRESDDTTSKNFVRLHKLFRAPGAIYPNQYCFPESAIRVNPKRRICIGRKLPKIPLKTEIGSPGGIGRLRGLKSNHLLFNERVARPFGADAQTNPNSIQRFRRERLCWHENKSIPVCLESSGNRGLYRK